MTLLAQGTIPDLMLYEDAKELCCFLEATGRTVLRTDWAEESIAAVADAMTQNMCGI